MAKLKFPDALICIDSQCCHSFPFHNAVSPVLTVLEIFVLTVAWNVFSHISWHYAINCLKTQGGIFFPLQRCSSSWDCCGFRSPFHPFRCWGSVLEVCPVEVKGAPVASPRGVSAAVPRALVAVVPAPAMSLAGMWDRQEFSLRTILLWVLLWKLFWVYDVCVTPVGLCLWVKVTHV